MWTILLAPVCVPGGRGLSVGAGDLPGSHCLLGTGCGQRVWVHCCLHCYLLGKGQPTTTFDC